MKPPTEEIFRTHGNRLFSAAYTICQNREDAEDAMQDTLMRYAADIGGIRRTVQIWLRGDQTNAVMEVKDGHYTLSYEDENGEPQEMGGGGVAMDAFGRERPLTEEELLEELNSPQVERLEEGSVWVYYRDQKMEITDKFVDGVCYVELKDGDKTLYLTVDREGGYSMSPHGYVQP